MKSIKVLILCGGIGKRMSPLTTDKALFKFLGKPLICHQISSAIESGIKDFIIITNPENDNEVRSSLTSIQNIQVKFVQQEKPLGMADAILSASEIIDGNPFILVSSNDVFDTSAYSSLLSEYKNNKDSSAYITARRVQRYFPGGYLVVDKQNKINGIVEKPPQGKEPSELINIVLHLHTKPEKLLDYLSNTSSTSDDVYEKSLDRMISDGYKIKAVTYTGVWQAIKYPWHILNVMDHFSKQIKRCVSLNSSISEKAVIDGNVIIEDNVRVFEGAVIRGDSYIGRNTVIGNGTLIRDSIIGDDCVVGYGTEIKHSYVGDGCWFHSNYIGDSILESDCSFGAGAITANFRLDEANIKIRAGNDIIDTGTDKLGAIIAAGCRIGINASLMPGIRIGANTFIGSHVCLAENVEANKKVIAEPNYRILSNDTILISNKKTELMKKLGGSSH